MKIMKERPASGLVVVLNMSCYFCVSGESDDHMWHFSREEGGSVPRSEIAPVSVCQAERRAQIFRSDFGRKVSDKHCGSCCRTLDVGTSQSLRYCSHGDQQQPEAHQTNNIAVHCSLC